MKNNDLTTNEDRSERLFFALVCMAAMVFILLIGCIAA
jgi:hypothetical protein